MQNDVRYSTDGKFDLFGSPKYRVLAPSKNMNPETVNRKPAAAASIVIPAHNEGAVIHRLLSAVPKQIGGGRLEIIVACNGCTDDTADVARRHGATVVETQTASKIAALNAADKVATAYPRLYIDADVVLSEKTVEDLIRALSEGGVLCAAPPARLVLDGRPWTVKAYFAVWKRVMLAREGYVGSGVYAVSKKGRERFGEFPHVIADDLFVRNTYSRDERRIVPTEPTLVEAPRTLRALLRRRVRVYLGNKQLRGHPLYKSLPGSLEPSIPWWRTVLATPSLIPAAFIYASINTLAVLMAHRRRDRSAPIEWARDNTTRRLRDDA